MVENVKLPDWETLFYMLCESAETGKEVKYGNIEVKHEYWGRADLWYSDDFNTNKHFDDAFIAIIGCEDEEEYAGECASILLEKLEKWHNKQTKPVATISEVSRWEQAEPFVLKLNRMEKAVYQNCCDYLYYGDSFANLIERGHNYDISKERTSELWKLAFYWMAEGCMDVA